MTLGKVLNNRSGAVLIFLLAIPHLLLIGLPLAHPDRFLLRDSFDYLDLANNLLATGQYEGAEFPDVDLKRPPGYPLFMALGLALGNGNTAAVSLLQVLLYLLIAFILYAIGRWVGGPGLGFTGVLFYFLNPNATFWSFVLLSETLAAFWLVLSLLGTVRFWQTRRPIWLFLSGACLGLSALTRPIALMLGGVWVLVLWWLAGKESGLLRQRARPLILCVVLGLSLLVVPWQFRNLTAHGRFTLSSVGEHTFKNWIVANTLAAAEGITRNEAVAQINAGPDDFAQSLAIIRRYPTVFVTEQIKGVIRTTLAIEYGTWARVLGGEQIETTGIISGLFSDGGLAGLSALLAPGRTGRWLWAGLYAFLYDLIAYGFTIYALTQVYLQTRRPAPSDTHREHILGRDLVVGLTVLLFTGLLYLLIIPLGAGQARFRVPADPLLAMLSGLGWIGWRWRHAKKAEIQLGAFQRTREGSQLTT